jgi:hypothetical protein
MAKKKNKKNTQKQVEVVSPPEELKAVNTTATEEPSANEEAEQQLPPPPVDAPTNNEIPVAGSTSIPDHDLEASQDTPSEDQTSMVAEALHNGETAEPSVDDHVHMSEASPEEEPVEPITDAELVALSLKLKNFLRLNLTRSRKSSSLSLSFQTTPRPFQRMFWDRKPKTSQPLPKLSNLRQQLSWRTRLLSRSPSILPRLRLTRRYLLIWKTALFILKTPLLRSLMWLQFKKRLSKSILYILYSTFQLTHSL